MKGMRGKLLKKLKSIKPIGYLKADTILHVHAADGWFFDSLTTKTTNSSTLTVEDTQLVSQEPEQEKIKQSSETLRESDVIDVSELMRDLEDEEDETEADDDKENVGPAIKEKSLVSCMENEQLLRKSEPAFGKIRPLSEIDVSSFRRPDMNSGSLFDPNLLAAFKEAVNEHISMSQEERHARFEQENLENKSRESEDRNAIMGKENLGGGGEEEEPPHKSRRIQEDNISSIISPLLDYKENCPPGGEESVILYTTSLRGIRKTFKDCSSVRFLLESFRVIYSERDVSMHMEFKEQLWRLVDKREEAVPPRLFIKGRYIGGASEVLSLHEQGKLRLLFQGVPLVDQSIGPCEACAGVRFVLCYKCNGSHKLVDDQGLSGTCHECNENGLIVCFFCC